MKSRQKQISKVLSRKVNTIRQSFLNNQQSIKGIIRTNGQEEGFAYCDVPSGAISVRFSCSVNVGMGGAVVCKVVAGGVPTMQTVIVSSLMSKTVDIPLKLSNTTAKISIQASDPNGAYASWELIYPSIAQERKDSSFDPIKRF